MKHSVTVHQLGTGRNGFLNVQDLAPVGVLGFAVWGSSLSAETVPDVSVAALALEYGPMGEIVLYKLVVCDTLKDFNLWLAADAKRYSIVYLITPSGLLVVSKQLEVVL